MRIHITTISLASLALTIAACQNAGAQKAGGDKNAPVHQDAIPSGALVPDQIEDFESYASGNAEHDRFLVGPDEHMRSIAEDSISPNPDNRLLVAHGFSPQNVHVRAEENGDMILFGPANVRIKGQFVELPGQQFGVQRVDFLDGGSWSREDLRRMVRDELPQIGPVSNVHGVGWYINGEQYNPPNTNRVIYANGDHDRFRVEDHKDTTEITEASTSQSPDNELQLGAGLLPGEASVDGYADGYNIRFPDRTTVNLALMRASRKGITYGVQKIVFTDGTVWTSDNLFDLAQHKSPTDDPNVPLWDDGKGRVIDSAKSTAISVMNGVEAFGGGDTIIYRRGSDGFPRFSIYEEDVSGNAHNTLQMGEGIGPDDISFGAEGENLIITVHSAQITVFRQLGAFTGREFGIQEVKFADGTHWDNTTFRAKLAQFGIIPPPANSISASLELVIDTGTPVVHGSGRGDTIIYRPIVGNAEIGEINKLPGSQNILKLEGPITPAMVKVFKGDGDDIILVIGKASSIELTDERVSGAGIQIVEFADGAKWSQADVIAAANRNPQKIRGLEIPTFGK